MDLAPRHNSLTEHLVAFTHFLRRRNYTVGIGELIVALDCLQYIDISKYTDYLIVLKSCFCRNGDQWKLFEENYDLFWKEYRTGVDAKIEEKKNESKNISLKKRKPRYQIDKIKNWLFNLEQDPHLEVPFYSPFSNIENKPFEFYDSEESRVLDHWIKVLLRKMAREKRRKKIRSTDYGAIDLKVLLKNRFTRGDELAKLYYRRYKREKSKLLFFCDVSRSMDLYSRFLTSLITQLPNIFNHSAVYLFNTVLYPLADNEDWKEVKGLWTGGTQIGHCLSSWLTVIPVWVDKRTRVMIFSDGWDTGDLPLLDTSLYRIKKHCASLYWLNPTSSMQDGETVAGIEIAKRHVDFMDSVYDLESLKKFIQSI